MALDEKKVYEVWVLDKKGLSMPLSFAETHEEACKLQEKLMSDDDFVDAKIIYIYPEKYADFIVHGLYNDHDSEDEYRVSTWNAARTLEKELLASGKYVDVWVTAEPTDMDVYNQSVVDLLDYDLAEDPRYY